MCATESGPQGDLHLSADPDGSLVLIPGVECGLSVWWTCINAARVPVAFGQVSEDTFPQIQGFYKRKLGYLPAAKVISWICTSPLIHLVVLMPVRHVQSR